MGNEERCHMKERENQISLFVFQMHYTAFLISHCSNSLFPFCTDGNISFKYQNKNWKKAKECI